MSKQVKILALAGAAHATSLNKKLLQTAVDGAQSAGAEVTVVDMKEYPLPLYEIDTEAESGMPENARKLKALFKDSDGFLIASPEHNSSYSALLKNAIDWVSRATEQGEGGGAVFRGKYAGIMAASPGALGGLRGLYPLRELLQNLGVTVIPAMQAVGQAGGAFDDTGKLKDEKTAKGVASIGAGLAQVLQKIKA
jgi:NAD(P)H-dependent FMN reductase